MDQETNSPAYARRPAFDVNPISWLAPLKQVSPIRWALGIVVGLASFVALGTVAAIWENPFFVRMTPSGGWEISLLALLSALAGLYVALRQPACTSRTAGMGGVFGFLGIACPVCNKVLLFLFGGEALLTYFEPVRIYVAAAGSTLMGIAVVLAYHRRLRSRSISGCSPSGSPAAPNY